MKIEELRIGNILQLDNGNLVSVVWFKLGKACILEVGKDYPTAMVDLERLSPILLSEEILFKCGFKENGFGGIFIITNNPSVLCLYKDGSAKWNDRYLDVKIKHLHQLQNLYYALTGKELEVKL